MAPPKKFKRVVALDGHRLGLVSGAVFALVVMGTSFFYQQVEFLATGIRAGWAFVAGYGATFFLIRVILRTTLFEFLEFEQKETKTRSRLGRTDAEEEDESVEGMPEASTAHDLLSPQTEGLTIASETETSDEMDVSHLGG